MFFQSALWDGRKHYLDRMTLRDLVKAYFAYPAIRVYLFLSVIGVALALHWMESWTSVFIVIAVTPMLYALSWYLLHRFVLHGRFLYKSPRTAALWKRIHFDHHQDPNDLEVLFGALPTTLPTILAITLPAGWLIAGPAGAAAGMAMGMWVTCFYEFCHCIQHLAYTPRLPLLKNMKKLHMAHHFHNEQGNYGITNFFWDRLLNTFYSSAGEVLRSSTVFNLGYVSAEYKHFPWVAHLSGLDVEKGEEKNPPEPLAPAGTEVERGVAN